MCFSASASFGAGILLSAIGVASFKKVQQPSQIPFASIPVIFAIQQISEGFLWLALTRPEYASLQQVSTYIFLFFAQIGWPVLVPLSILMLEENESRKKADKVLLLMGITVSAYLGYCLIFYNVQAEIIGYHISYQQPYPEAIGFYAGALYIMATVLPSFFSTIRWMWVLGTAIFVSYIITYIFYEDYIVSVWCFFASVISIAVLGIMRQIEMRYQKDVQTGLKPVSTNE